MVFFSQCAKRGNPNGGPKDTIPPVVLKSSPENYSINFKGDEIKIYFDEFIKLKALQQQLIVSPPLTYQPVITPISAAKVLKIKIKDTLEENTTYVFNFGTSIVDNNEGNEFEYFEYVFSTGDYIDSLQVRGTLKESLYPNLQQRTTVMLYEVSETFTDSILFKEKPKYVTSTKEGDAQFELRNLKEGTYMLVALQEETSNYTYEPRTDKVAFLKEFVQIPTDSTFQLSLFEETLPYQMTRPSHISKHKIAFGYEGNVDSLNVNPMFSVPEGYSSRWLRDPKKDSLNYWFKPAFDITQTDTLTFLAKNRGQLDTLQVKLKELYADSLEVRLVGSSTIIPRDSVRIGANTPLSSFNEEKIVLLDKDSLVLDKQVVLDTLRNEAVLVFDKAEDQTYRLTAYPEALTDFFEQTNDTLQYTLRTKALSDYGTIQFNLQGLEDFPVLVELTNEKFEVVASTYLEENNLVYFDYLEPANYFLRIVYDTNKNKQWDTGNYLQKLQPEKIVYYPSPIEIRANWDKNETFILE